MVKRRAFSKQQIRQVYESQGGICADPECSADLSVTGFARDHIDGNPSNVKITNLRLLCPKHHRLTETYGKHQEEMTETLYSLHELIAKGLEGDLTGSHIKGILDAIDLNRKISYGLYMVPAGIEKVDWIERVEDLETLQKIKSAELKGYSEGLAAATRLISAWSKNVFFEEKVIDKISVAGGESEGEIEVE